MRLSHQLALCALLPSLVLSGAAGAQPKPGASAAAGSSSPLDEAQRRYGRAVELFNEGSYDAALLEFRRAYELAPSFRILYNIGQVNKQLNDYAQALAAFERYLKEGGAEVPPARVTEVQKEVERLRGKVARLDITATVEGAEVSVDDLVVGKTPFSAPILVNAGRRKVAVSAPGKLPASRVVEVAGGDSLSLPFDLQSPTPVATGTGSASLPPPAPVERRPVPWVPWAAAGVLVAGGVVTGSLALGAKSSFDQKLGTLGTTQSQLDDAQSKARTLGLVTDLLFASGIVVGGVALYLTLRPSPRSSETGAQVSLLRVGVGPGTLQMTGAF